MQVLFVHGMGRSPLSGWPLLQRLRAAGWRTESFGYQTALADFDTLSRRLSQRLQRLAEQGDYVVIGHSLGGLLLRSAVSQLPADVARPRHAVLLGSPVKPARLATSLRGRLLFRLLTRDCGQMLASPERMAAVPPMPVPTTAIVGVKGLLATRSWFGAEPNDGVVAASEVKADWQAEQIEVDEVHTWLPSSAQVAALILARLPGSR
jgi:pimeloyl-ACP methyl ester carboxylesterase